MIVAKTESFPSAPCPPPPPVADAPPAPTVTVYASPVFSVSADSIEPPPPDIFGVETPPAEV